MAQDYTNMSVKDKLKLADERLEKLKGIAERSQVMARKTEMPEDVRRMTAEKGEL